MKNNELRNIKANDFVTVNDDGTLIICRVSSVDSDIWVDGYLTPFTLSGINMDDQCIQIINKVNHIGHYV